MRQFVKLQRIVVKIGTATLTQNGRLDQDYLFNTAQQLAQIKQQGIHVLLVTSGAIGLGALEAGFATKPSGIPLRQALAAIGQPHLMQAWREAFQKVNLKVAQVLVTYDVFSHRPSYLSLRNTVETLLSMNVVPIFNENDAISIAEITRAFGDNDRLSALVASKVNADLLILLSDVDALYDSDPRTNPQAQKMTEVKTITPELLNAAGRAGTNFSTGGMKTKLHAAQIAQKAGCSMVLAHGREPLVIWRVVQGEELGTHFLPHDRQPSRKRWLALALPQGWLTVDEGAMKALRSHKSLLPSGVVAVEGEFNPGSVVSVNGQIKLISKYSSQDLRKILGKSLNEVEAILGYREVIARPEDMAFLDEIDPLQQ